LEIHSLDSRGLLTFCFFFCLVSTCFPVLPTRRAISPPQTLCTSTTRVYRKLLKLYLLRKKNSIIKKRQTSPDIFHIAVYHFEYIDNFVYSAQQKKRLHRRRSRYRGKLHPRPKVTCSIVVVIIVIIIVNLYIHEKPQQKKRHFHKERLTTIFPLAFVAAALEDLPAGAKVN
jgi:hypothetical protein